MKQIGKYQVTATASGSEEGGWQARLLRRWVENGKTMELKHTVDAVLPTETEALINAYHHALLQVEEGVW